MPDLVHIEIRREPAITPDEWKAALSTSPDMRLVHSLHGVDPRTGVPIEASAPNTGEWTGHPDDIPYHFRFRAGHIEVQWADDHCERKARDLAAALEAAVSVRQGD
jgi:hypothetical protein